MTAASRPAALGDSGPGHTALLFPGQGSQCVGMGRDLAGAFPQALAVYQQADDILGFRLSRLCFEGPEGALNDTVNTQPALFVTSMALFQILSVEGILPPAAMAAGHSLGEITALAAAGAMDFADGLRLTRERGRLMKLAGETNPGGMAAILKVDDSEVERACREASRETGRPVQIANYNTPEQTVISGHRDALARAIDLLRDKGVRRIVPLAVSIAAHSELMSPVQAPYRQAVDETPFRAPGVPVIGNVSAHPLETVDAIRDDLTQQLTQPVQWTASVQWMAEQGVTDFIEIGPKDVLARLVHRLSPTAMVLSIGDADAIRALGPWKDRTAATREGA